MRHRRRDVLSNSAVELVVLRVNAVRGDVAALLVVGADFGEAPVRSVRIAVLDCVKSERAISPRDINLAILFILHPVPSIRSWSVGSYGRSRLPRGALSSVRGRWWATTLHRQSLARLFLHWADLWPWSSRRAA